MRKPIAAAVIAASAATAGCGTSRAEESGATVSRNYQIGDFKEIEVAGPYDVTVQTGRSASVSASGSERLLERTVVEVKGDRLVIHPRRKSWWRNIGFRSDSSARFTVSVPQLNLAAIAGSGDVRVDKIRGDQFTGSIAGSGGLDVGNVEVQALKLTVSGSGSVRTGAGKAQTANYSIAGSGDIDARAVQTQQAKVSIAGSGDIAAHASETAEVRIAGSGDVDMTGGAKCTVKKAGSGDVRCS